jgi:SNF2 family DNA or RNA helicase
VDFAVGNYVLKSKVIKKPRDNKLHLKWHGPYRVVKALNSHVYEVQHLLKADDIEPCHVSRLKLYSCDLEITELLEEIGGKVIIFVPLKGVQLYLKEKLVADKYTVELVNGDVSKKDRDEMFYNFQHTDQPQILLAHPKVAAHGLTLTRAKDIIWYAPIYSLEQYEQAKARIRRLNTEGKTSVWHIYATKFEAELYRRLRLKQNTLTEFLDLVRGINDDD